MENLQSTKLSQLTKATNVNLYDLLYLVQPNDDEFTSKSITVEHLIDLITPAGGGLPDISQTTLPDIITPAEFSTLVNGTLGTGIPAEPTSQMVMIRSSDSATSMGVITQIPTDEGKYVIASGFNALGGDVYGSFIMYIGRTGIPAIINYFTLPNEKVTVVTTGIWPHDDVSDDLSAEHSHAVGGTSSWWKTTLTLTGEPINQRLTHKATLTYLPCSVDGEVLPYELSTHYVDRNTLVLMLVVHGDIAKLRSPTTGTELDYGSDNYLAYELVYWH